MLNKKVDDLNSKKECHPGEVGWAVGAFLFHLQNPTRVVGMYLFSFILNISQAKDPLFERYQVGDPPTTYWITFVLQIKLA